MEVVTKKLVKKLARCTTHEVSLLHPSVTLFNLNIHFLRTTSTNCFKFEHKLHVSSDPVSICCSNEASRRHVASCTSAGGQPCSSNLRRPTFLFDQMTFPRNYRVSARRRPSITDLRSEDDDLRMRLRLTTSLSLSDSG